MSVHKKLMEARIALQNTKLEKTGHNKFAGYKYFELGDFLPAVQKIFVEKGLSGYVSYLPDVAVLTITDIEDGTQLFINSPMATAALKGAHDIQNLGAVQTYLRRYLWVTAMEIVEHDVLDASLGSESPSLKPPFKPAKAEPAKAIPAIPAIPKAKVATNMNTGNWAISVEDVASNLPAVILAAESLLAIVEKEEDLKAMFQINRGIFDQVQKASPEEYQALMGKFTETKEKFLTKE